VSLPDCLQQVGERIVGYCDAPGGDAPYLLYVYPPREEFAVRRDLGDLRLWLQAKNIQCVAVSLADLFWEALEDSGWLETLIEAEKAAADDPAALEQVYRSVGEILRESPTLAERIIAALPEDDDRTAAFLSRAGALYPAYRTSGLLDELRPQLHLPLTLLYPGRLVGSYGLSFMDRCEPAYGYRATIIPRGGDS